MNDLVAPPAAPARDLVIDHRPALPIAAPRDAAALALQAQSLRVAFARPPATRLRRLLWLWFRVFVRETKRGRVERVNVRIPIPIPLVGALLPGRMSGVQALKALGVADAAPDAAASAELATYVDSVMGFEFVRVEEHHPERDHTSLVVVGFD